MTRYQTLRFGAARGIGRLTLDRPERLNAMTNRMVVEIHDCPAEVAGRDDVRVLVLNGAGRGFCPGAYAFQGGTPSQSKGSIPSSTICQMLAWARPACTSRKPMVPYWVS